MPKNCRSNEMIHRFIDGELSKKETARFEMELSEDESLQSSVSFYRKLIKDLKAFQSVKFPSRKLNSARATLLQRVETLP